MYVCIFDTIGINTNRKKSVAHIFVCWEMLVGLLLVIVHKQSSWWLKLRRAWWEPLNGEGGGWQQSFHILISPHSCSNTIALHKSFSRHAYSIIFFRPRFWSTSFPQWQHLGGWFNHGHITMQMNWWWRCWLACGLLYPWPLHDEIWTCAKFAICKLLFVSSAFANLFFMWVSGSWASLFSRASENDYGAHHTTTSLPAWVEKFTWQKHLKI